MCDHQTVIYYFHLVYWSAYWDAGGDICPSDASLSPQAARDGRGKWQLSQRGCSASYNRREAARREHISIPGFICDDICIQCSVHKLPIKFSLASEVGVMLSALELVSSVVSCCSSSSHSVPQLLAVQRPISMAWLWLTCDAKWHEWLRRAAAEAACCHPADWQVSPAPRMGLMTDREAGENRQPNSLTRSGCGFIW